MKMFFLLKNNARRGMGGKGVLKKGEEKGQKKGQKKGEEKGVLKKGQKKASKIREF